MITKKLKKETNTCCNYCNFLRCEKFRGGYYCSKYPYNYISSPKKRVCKDFSFNYDAYRKDLEEELVLKCICAKRDARTFDFEKV